MNLASLQRRPRFVSNELTERVLLHEDWYKWDRGGWLQKGGVSTILTIPVTEDLSAASLNKQLDCTAEKPTSFLSVYSRRRYDEGEDKK